MSLNLSLEGELAEEVKGAEFKGLKGQYDENTVLRETDPRVLDRGQFCPE